ncbi:MAG: adenosine deaminase [Acidimicrobiia bacterium]
MNIAHLDTLPKAVLHEHLDGSLRIGTVLELAEEAGYGGLPTSDRSDLAAWFYQGDSGSLENYLEAFDQTIAVLTTRDALARVAEELVEDLAADGAVYAEVRFGPSLHVSPTLEREDAIEAVLDGLARGSAKTGCAAYLIVGALRQYDDSEAVARAASRFVGEGVVGFDLAGPEAGYPCDDHLPAINHAREAGLGITIHAGEGDGPNSIWRALGRCGAARIGHGVRIIEDAVLVDGDIEKLGKLARMVRDHRVPLEMCITSNLHTGVADSAEDHPFGALWRAGFAVTINTDNQLMSQISLGHEYALAAETFGLSIQDVGRIVERTIEAGFGDWSDRKKLLTDVIRPAYGIE